MRKSHRRPTETFASTIAVGDAAAKSSRVGRATPLRQWSHLPACARAHARFLPMMRIGMKVSGNRSKLK